MKDLIWDNTLSVEVKEIDDDHQKLLELFNLLVHSVADGDEKNYIKAVLEELISFAIWHFRHEERLMMKYDYPGSAEHKAEHMQLIESAREFQQKILLQGKTHTIEDIAFLEQWLTGHILGADMDLGAYLGRSM